MGTAPSGAMTATGTGVGAGNTGPLNECSIYGNKEGIELNYGASGSGIMKADSLGRAAAGLFSGQELGRAGRKGFGGVGNRSLTPPGP